MSQQNFPVKSNRVNIFDGQAKVSTITAWKQPYINEWVWLCSSTTLQKQAVGSM